MNNRVRNSNYELMRIVSMFLIVLCHVINLGHVLHNCVNPSLQLIFKFIMYFTIVHVNSFVLVSGYYQSTSTFKQSSVWSIINANWFYRIVIMVLFLILGFINVDKVTFIKEAFPLNINEYWFIRNYILLYCLSPFINMALNSFDKKGFKKLLLVLFIIFSLIPTFTGNNFLNNNGYTLYSFVCLYIVGAYLRRYPLEKSYLFKNTSKGLYQLILLFTFFFMLIANFVNTSFFSFILKYNPVIKEFGGYIVNTRLSYSNPFIVIQSIAYFLFFGTLTIKNNKVINKLASLTFGVYLIHENNFVRSLLYTWIGIDGHKIYSYSFLINVFCSAIGIYVVCSLIEFLRQILFKFIYDRKISLKIRTKYYNYIFGIKFNN